MTTMIAPIVCEETTSTPGKCGCICEGPDCANLFYTVEACEAAHAQCKP